MKKTFLVCCALALTLGAQAQWKPVGDKIKTKWAEQINPKNVLPEYPRPQLERTDWVNLNGEWEYAIKPRGGAEPAAACLGQYSFRRGSGEGENAMIGEPKPEPCGVHS